MPKTMNTPRRQSDEGNGNRASLQSQDALQPLDDARDYLVKYARQQPEMAALVIFGVGFVLGWKLKPW